MNKKQSYVNFHCHSTFSILDAVGRIPELLKRAEEIGMPSLAITDHGSLNAISDLYLWAPKSKIKPIYGIEAYFIHDLDEWKIKKEEIALDKTKNNKEIKKYNHLILLAKNEEGLKNLYFLNFHSQKYNVYYKPRIDKKLLAAHSKGLICSTACMLGSIPQKILALYYQQQTQEQILNNLDLLNEVKFFKDTFGDDFYLEIQINELNEQKIINKVIFALAEKTNTKVIVTCDNHYIQKEHAVVRDVMMAIRSKTTLEEYGKKEDEEEVNDETQECRELYLKSAEELLESKNRLGYDFITDEMMEKCFETTLEINDKIKNIEIDTSTKLVKPKVEGDSFEFLKKNCNENFDKFVKDDENQTYRKRLDYELDIIKQKEIYDYLLLTKNIIDYASKDMMVGVGRGSAAGSLVCYLLGITKIDPVKYGLLFGRFISLNRKELPDIDSDFEDPELIKQHLATIYGEDNVAYVSTYTVFQMKSLVKDYCRVFNIANGDFTYPNELNKKIIEEIEGKVTYDGKIQEENDDIKLFEYEDYYKKSPAFKEFIDRNKNAGLIVSNLYNQVRQIGKHPAGTIVVDNLAEKQPLQFVKGKVQTSYTEGLINKNLGKMGFVKLDLLGLNTLKIINDAVKIISKNHKIDYNKLKDDIQPLKINEFDEKVYEHVFEKGNFAGIFQFSEQQMRDISQRIKPKSVKELGDIVAIVRPGPLSNGFHTMYMDRKEGLEKVQYLHPILEKCTKDTYGLLIYQEQIMQTSIYLAGMSEAESNDLRKVMSKIDKSGDKSKDLLELEEKFILGAEKNGCDLVQAKEIWDIMEKFSGYAFNLSHSICYAMTAFQCAWLKTYYPEEFYCSLLSNTEEKDEINEIISEAEKNGIKILPPDVNISEKEFTIKDNKIYFGLKTIAGLGDKAVEVIIAKRPYISVKDFAERTKSRAANKKVFQNLVLTNAFASFSPIEEIFKDYPQTKIFEGEIKKGLPRCEREILGFNISFKDEEEERKKKLIREFLKQGKMSNYKDVTMMSSNFYGKILGVEKKKTKTNKDMLKLRLEDIENQKMTAFVWDRTIKKIENTTAWQNLFYQDAIIFFNGKVNNYNGNNLLQIDSVYKL